MNGYDEPNDNKRKIAIAAAIAVLVLAVVVLVVVIVRRGSPAANPGAPAGTNNGTGTTTGDYGFTGLTGGQKDAPLKERTFATPEGNDAGEAAAPDQPSLDPIDPTINYQLSAADKIAAGFPPDASVRQQAFRDQNGMVYLELVVDSLPADADADGVSDEEERKFGTDAQNKDTDGDKVGDAEEVYDYRTDPKNPDTDGDGVSDYDEIRLRRTDPLQKPPTAPAPVN